MQRYFAINEKLELKKDDIYHIKKVMRMKEKDEIEVVYNEKVFLCEIKNIDDFKIDVKEEKNENRELSKKVTICFSLVNEAKTDFILQKSVELGAYDFIPLQTERSKIKIDKKEDKKIERWNKITKEASEQSYRNIIPEVKKIDTINNIINYDYDLKIICSTKEKEKTIKNVLQNSTKYDNIIIVVGPEGGFTEKEEEFLINNGFISVSLGDTILRAETAPLFLMSAIRYELMR